MFLINIHVCFYVQVFNGHFEGLGIYKGRERDKRCDSSSSEGQIGENIDIFHSFLLNFMEKRVSFKAPTTSESKTSMGY